VGDFNSGSELASIFAGADVGLALFDAELSLLACNSLYRSLCGYLTTEAASGCSLQELMRITFHRQNVPEDEIEQRIERIVKGLEPGASYTFRYASPSAQVVEVRRRCLQNGAIVETVRQVEGQLPEIDLNAQFEMIAEKSRSRLMHALDVMADGFALYDSSDRLVLYNRKYVDYSPLVADIIMPGAPKEEILRESVRRGAVVLNGMAAEDYIAWRLHMHRNPGEPLEVQLADLAAAPCQEHAFRYGPDEHDPGPLHVRQGTAADRGEPALSRNIRLFGGCGEARHHAARPHGIQRESRQLYG
jgi:PAS domain-containing protein